MNLTYIIHFTLLIKNIKYRCKLSIIEIWINTSIKHVFNNIYQGRLQSLGSLVIIISKIILISTIK